ncbi:AMIN-like domain-containing (lipo)protein, partial [Arthrobacter sp. ZGTC412]|uniref:AMIN-like domain-containing (lipo)protein n=1 Tax=Arthrobacter sp. ZGTC412 TaxID=2058900 RepID=UPI000CE45C79
MKKLTAWLTAIIMALGLGLLAPGFASATTSYCGLAWSSLAKSNQAMSGASVTNIRSGQHLCFDRLVIDINGKAAGYNVRYVSKAVQDGSGLPIKLRGGAFLQVTAHSPSYDSATGKATFVPANRSEVTNVSNYNTFRQVAWAGSFEGHTSLGLGVRARLPFKVFTLAGPGSGSKLVIDVAHHW